jgi:hypothetical protein
MNMAYATYLKSFVSNFEKAYVFYPTSECLLTAVEVRPVLAQKMRLNNFKQLGSTRLCTTFQGLQGLHECGIKFFFDMVSYGALDRAASAQCSAKKYDLQCAPS